MNILLIAPLVSHATFGRIAAFINTNMNVSLFDISSRSHNYTNNIYPINKLKTIYSLNVDKIDRTNSNQINYQHIIYDLLRSNNLLEENRYIMNTLKDILISEEIDIVVCYYGPIAIKFLRIIKKINPSIKTVLIPNLIPSTIITGNKFISKFKKIISNEFMNYRKWLNTVDIIFAASTQMKDYIIDNYYINSSQIYIMPDFHPKSFFIKNINSKDNVNANTLVFLGAPERWGGQIDNIDAELNDIILKDIKLCVNERVKFNSSLNCDSYRYFSDYEVFNGILAQTLHYKTVSLITYNNVNDSDRFKSTLPTRFFTALSAGLVIAVKANNFYAVESFIKKYNIGFVYKDLQDLKTQLMDIDKLKFYRNNIFSHIQDFYAESQSKQIIQILNNING